MSDEWTPAWGELIRRPWSPWELFIFCLSHVLPLPPPTHISTHAAESKNHKKESSLESIKMWVRLYILFLFTRNLWNTSRGIVVIHRLCPISVTCLAEGCNIFTFSMVHPSPQKGGDLMWRAGSTGSCFWGPLRNMSLAGFHLEYFLSLYLTTLYMALLGQLNDGCLLLVR